MHHNLLVHIQKLLHIFLFITKLFVTNRFADFKTVTPPIWWYHWSVILVSRFLSKEYAWFIPHQRKCQEVLYRGILQQPAHHTFFVYEHCCNVRKFVYKHGYNVPVVNSLPKKVYFVLQDQLISSFFWGVIWYVWKCTCTCICIHTMYMYVYIIIMYISSLIYVHIHVQHSGM